MSSLSICHSVVEEVVVSGAVYHPVCARDLNLAGR